LHEASARRLHLEVRPTGRALALCFVRAIAAYDCPHDLDVLDLFGVDLDVKNPKNWLKTFKVSRM
jgi:hypothetical protein